jgi:hypothetical protein
VSYRDCEGQLVQETTGTPDREEAGRFLRQRLDARDQGVLPAILASRSLNFKDWAAWFLENRSKPPCRARKTHLQNLNAVHMLEPTFGSTRLWDITPAAFLGAFSTLPFRQKRLTQKPLHRRRVSGFRE